MAFVSVTRLRVRSWRFMPAFLIETQRTTRQVRRAVGFNGGALLADRARAFWTLTLWDDREAMRAYMASGAHLAAMPRLLDWCDEASVVHWEGVPPVAPGWIEADARMRRDGRPSKVRHPSADHAAMAYAPPRLTASATIRAA